MAAASATCVLRLLAGALRTCSCVRLSSIIRLRLRDAPRFVALNLDGGFNKACGRVGGEKAHEGQ